ncbi:MAG: RIP metalloprotease RseP [Candidatus Endonucleobacter bathymodioli]|uniref:Zinc metalloprotease n=1 Tax=Candidatus Endonucleibacter bathymodioli TaxID=539814 RepID=A0AA90NV17_9GAMM|nr:RIP metalloprotease RseP [Candidatus Endonucleobacter bathymodioli]
MEALQAVVAFVFTLGILVGVHEYGHFWVARRCGVKVLRFSIGFGKRLWTRTDCHGTEFSLAAIPLGGYVKMLDEREGPVPDNEKHLSFNNKTVISRIAIVAAGPAANFLLAIVALWLMYLLGVKAVIPVVGEVLPNSPAAEAEIRVGDEILSVDGKDVYGWQDVNMALLSLIGETGVITVSVRSGEMVGKSEGFVFERKLVFNDWLVGNDPLDPLNSLGVVPYAPVIIAVIGEVVAGGAAAGAGIVFGDKILSVDGIEVKDWIHWVDLVRASPNKEMVVDVLRSEHIISLTLIPKVKEIEGQEVGYIGAGVQEVIWPDGMVRTQRFNPITALFKGAETTWILTSMTFGSLWKMVIGLLSVKNLSGPITIAKVASASLSSGFESFLYFLGILSVSLGVLNLLPIPVLDGGHLMFYLVELVRGKALSEWVQELGLKIGMALVMCVMILAIYNDLARLF